MKPTLLILAAGMGSRYGGLKQLDAVGPSGETIMDYSIYDAKEAGFGKVIFVIRKSLEKDFQEKIFSKYQDFIEIDYVFQELENLPDGFTLPTKRNKPWGTAHAVLVAKPKINENFAVINADDFYGKTAYQSMFHFLNNTDLQDNTHCLLTYNLKNTISKYGSVSRGVCKINKENNLMHIVEHTKIYSKDNLIYSEHASNTIKLKENTPISMNFMGFTPQIFSYIEQYFISFLNINANKPKAEFYLPSLLANLIKNKEASINTIPTAEQWFGVTYKEDKEQVIKGIQEKIEAGEYPIKLY